jgi:hypothetical protein
MLEGEKSIMNFAFFFFFYFAKVFWCVTFFGFFFLGFFDF